jgi:hypothetical protein
MDKSLLHWSIANDSPDKPGDTPDKPKIEKTQATSEAKPIPREILKMLPIMPPQPMFEDGDCVEGVNPMAQAAAIIALSERLRKQSRRVRNRETTADL